MHWSRPATAFSTGDLELNKVGSSESLQQPNRCAVNISMIYLWSLPPSHPFGHSLPSSIFKYFPQAIRLDNMQGLHLSSPAEASWDKLANEKTRQAAAVPGRSTSQELQFCGGSVNSPFPTLPERPLTIIPVENLRAGSAARRESQILTPTTAAHSHLEGSTYQLGAPTNWKASLAKRALKQPPGSP